MCPQPPARALGSHPRESRRVPLTSPGGPRPRTHPPPPPPHPQQNHKTQMALEGREEAAASIPLHRLPPDRQHRSGRRAWVLDGSTPAPGPLVHPAAGEDGARHKGRWGGAGGGGVGEGDAASRKGVTLLNWQLSTSVHFTSTKRNTWISSLLRGA